MDDFQISPKRVMGCATLAVLGSLLLIGGCNMQRIDDSEVGVRRTFGGEIETTELGTGWHQTILGDIYLFAAKEILLTENNLTPFSKDKSVLKDFDYTFTYTVDTTKVAEYFKSYSRSSHLELEGHDEMYPMGNFVTGIVRASAYSAVAEYDALQINNNRSVIEQRIVAIANEKLAHEGLPGIKVKLVNIRNIELAPDVVASANMVVKSQNDLATKKNEVLIATEEAKRIQALTAQSGNGYVQLLDAQARKVTADATLVQANAAAAQSVALGVSAEKGGVIWVVPSTFTALGNIPSNKPSE